MPVILTDSGLMSVGETKSGDIVVSDDSPAAIPKRRSTRRRDRGMSTPETPTPSASLLRGTAVEREQQIAAFRAAGGGSAGEAAVRRLTSQVEQREQQAAQEARERRQGIVGTGSGVIDVNTDRQIGQSFVAASTPLSLRERLFASRVEAERVGGVRGLAAGGRTFFRTSPRIREEKEEFERKVAARQQRFAKVEDAEVVPGTDIPGGTAQDIRLERTPKEELLRDAALGDKVALEAVAQRTQKELNQEAEAEATRQLNIDQRKVDEFARVEQEKINKGLSTVEESEARIKDYASRLDEERVALVNERLNPKIQEEQRKLDRASEKGRLVRVGLTSVAAFAAGAVLTPAVAVLPRTVQTGIGVAAGFGVAAGASRLAERVRVGEAGAVDVIEFTAPIVAFGLGSQVARYVKGVKPAEFDTAMRNSELRLSGKPKVLTTEKQIEALRISEAQKTELLARLRTGNRVFVQEYKIVNPNPKQQRLIDKVIPNREVVTIGAVDSAGNVIVGKSVTRVRVGKGLNRYIEFQTGQSLGLQDAKTGKAVVDTVTIRAKKTGELIEAAKTRAVIDTKFKLVRDLTTGQVVGRGVKVRSLTFKGDKLKPIEGEISFDSLVELAASEKFGRFPSFKTTQAEMQAVRLRAVELKKVTGTDLLLTRAVQLRTTKAAGVTKRVQEPVFEFSKTTKPFEPDTPAPPKLKPPKLTKAQARGLAKMDSAGSVDIKQVKSEFAGRGVEIGDTEFMRFPPETALESIKFGARQVLSTPTTWIIPSKVPDGIDTRLEATFEESKIDVDVNKLQRDLGRAAQDIDLLGVQKGKEEERAKLGAGGLTFVPLATKTRETTKQLNTVLPAQLQLQKQKQKQLLKRLQTQVQALTLIPPAPILKLDVPKTFPPGIFGFPLHKPGMSGKDLRKLGKRMKRRISGYTASLGAAAVQAKPVQVTKKQFEKLKKKVFFGETRPVLEIVSDDTEKIAKKAVQF